MRTVDSHTALAFIQSRHNVFVQGAAATPLTLLRELVSQRQRLEEVNLIHLHTSGEADYARPEYTKHFRITNLFVGENIRKRMNQENVDYLPCFLSEIPSLFSSGVLPLDVALIHVSPPDRHGYCSLGTSVDITVAAVRTAKYVIAQVNPQMPRVHGDGMISVKDIDAAVLVDEPLPLEKTRPHSDDEQRIGKLVASLVEDGATLQVGVGGIPNAALHFLQDRKHLGIHTETWSDSAMTLIQCGAVDNSLKAHLPGKTVSSFVAGSPELYRFIDDNPSIVQMSTAYVNNPEVIAANPKVVSLNSAIEVDLTGQVCADSLGSRVISGVGGQMDFVRGATKSVGGKAIIAMTSRTARGVPKIVPTLRLGAGVVTTRAHVHYVITEHGIANLWGKTLRDRAQQLISVAHPDDREGLDKNWWQLCKL